MTVPDEAIEAAAKAAYESTMEDGDTPWEHFGGSSYLDYYRDHARAALEAAAPYLRAQALGDAADALIEWAPFDRANQSAALWLRARAAAERGGE